MEKIKYIVAPTERCFSYWIRELGIKRDTVKLVLTPDNARGINFKEDNTLFLVGEKYHYPEIILRDFGRKQQDEYYEMFDMVRKRIAINKRKQDNQGN